MHAMCCVPALSALALSSAAHAAVVLNFNDPSGLAAQAEFALLSPTQLQITLRNTSTAVPADFGASDQILTGLSWDFGGATSITGGTVIIGGASASVNFSTGSYRPGTDVGGEWGYGNGGTTNMFSHFISANQAGTTVFGGPNLDGPSTLAGPQGGLVADPLPTPIGGQGGIQNEIVATLTLSNAINDLSFLTPGAARVEFGSDRAFLTFVPSPGAAGLLGVAGFAALRRRR